MSELLQALISGILIGGVYGLFSMGLTLVFGVMKLVNFAHGEFIMLGMYFTYVLYTFFHVPLIIAIIIVVPVMYGIGVLLYKGLFKRVMGHSDLPQIVLTVALSLFIQTVMMMIFTSDMRTMDTPYGGKFYHLGHIFINQAQLIAFVVALVCSLGLGQMLVRTDVGKAMRAAVDDLEMALMVGINSQKIYALAVGIGNALAGLAGAVILLYYPVFPTVGVTFLCLGFVVIVLGGMGNITGAFIGGLLLGCIQQISAVYISVDLQNAVLFILFVIILLVKPTGLMGKEGTL